MSADNRCCNSSSRCHLMLLSAALFRRQHLCSVMWLRLIHGSPLTTLPAFMRMPLRSSSLLNRLPTDLASLFQAMSVQATPDNNHYVDTDASSHMTNNHGINRSLTPCNSKFIMVGSGALIPINYTSYPD